MAADVEMVLCLALAGDRVGLVVVGRPTGQGRPVMESADLSRLAVGDNVRRLRRLYHGLDLAWGCRSSADREQLAPLLDPCPVPPLPRPLKLGPLVPRPGASDAYQLAWRLAAAFPLGQRWRPPPCPTRPPSLPSS